MSDICRIGDRRVRSAIRLARLLGAIAVGCASARAAVEAQVLAEVRKTKPDVAEVHVIAEKPLLVAISGPQGTRQTPSDWARGELLGVFAHRGEQIVPISILPNNDYPTAIWIERQNVESITFGLADPDYGVRSDNLKIFFDPKMLLPRRILRFAPVHVRRITNVANVVTISGSDGKQDFTARQQGAASGATWRVTAVPAAVVTAPRPVESQLQVPPMPSSTFGQFEAARPEKAALVSKSAIIEEKIGPSQKVGNRIWIGKTFYDAEGTVGVGDIGYFDVSTQAWSFLQIREMADWSASAILVETDAIWAGRVRNGEDAGEPGGLLRYDRSTHAVTTIELPDVINRIVRVGKQIYCGTSGGFAIVDNGRARRFEFDPQLDGTYVVAPL